MSEPLKSLPSDVKIIGDGEPLKALPSDVKIIKEEPAVITEPVVKQPDFSKTDEIINNIPDLSSYQKDKVRELAKSGVDSKGISESIQAFQKQNKDDVTVWSDKPKAGFGEYAYNKLASGSAKLGSILAKAPAMAYDVVAQPFNYVASGRMMNDLTPVPMTGELAEKVGLNETPFKSSDVGAQLGFTENKIAKYYDEDVKARQAIAATRYDQSIEDYISNGEYSKAIGAISGAVLESAPTTISLMMGNAAGIGAVGSTIGGGIAFAADKKSELDNDENAKNLTEQEKINIAMSNGLFEGLFEQFGITKLGGLTKNVLLRSGEEEAKKVAIDGFKNIYLQPLKTYLGTSVAEESLSEAATQFAQNAVDKYSGYKPDLDLKEGVVDAAIIGAASGGGMGAPTAVLEVGANKKANQNAEIIKKQELLAKEDTRSKNAFDVSGKGEETILSFEENVNTAVANGNITPEEGEKAKFRVRAYQTYREQTKDLKIDDDSKRKVFDLSYQKQGLETELKDVNKDELNPIELAKYEGKVKQAKDLQKEINDIILVGQVKEEKIAADKTIKDANKSTQGTTDTEEDIEDPVLKALNEKYKKEAETGYKTAPTREEMAERKAKGLPLDERKMTEVDPAEFNKPKYNDRVKNEQVAKHIEEDLINGIGEGVLTEQEFVYDGKKGSTYYVQLPSGHRIRLSSSMEKPTQFRGYMRTEHLPGGKGQVEGFPVGMKVVRTPPGANGETTAIKIFNAKTGKFISWAKATTKGADILEQPVITADEKFAGKAGITKEQRDAELKRRDVLAREEMLDRNEAPFAATTSSIQTTINEGQTTTNAGVSQTTKTTKKESGQKAEAKTPRQRLYEKIRNTVRENFEKFTGGKLAEMPTEGANVTPDEIANRVINDSENPIQLVEAYIGAENTNVNSVRDSKQGAIYNFFKNGFKLSKKAYAELGDPKFMNTKDMPGMNTYLSDNGLYYDKAAESASGEGIDVTAEDIINFINDYPRGLGEFENSYKDSPKSKIAKRFKELTGETLNDFTANAILDELYNEPLPRENEELTEEELLDKLAEDKARKEYEKKFPEGDKYQKPKSEKKDVDKERLARVDKVKNAIQKVLPKVKVVYDENLDAAGKLSGNTIYINPFYAEGDTPIHEAAHILLDAMGENKVVKKAIEQLRGTDLWKETEKRYSDYSEAALANEVLAEAIGREGNGIFDSVSEESKFKQYLNYILDWFKQKLGLEKNIAKALARQIISGIGTKKLKGSEITKEQIVGEKAKLKKQILEDRKSAEIMELMNESPEKIRLTTGWEKGIDGLWRYEIGDENAKIKKEDYFFSRVDEANRGPKDITYYVGNLSDVLEYKELYRLYSDLKNTKIEIYYGKGNDRARYYPNKKTIGINARSFIKGEGASEGNVDKLREMLIHEVQHIIQNIEGFASGGNERIAHEYLLSKYNDLAEDEFNKLKLSGIAESVGITFEDVLVDTIYKGEGISPETKYSDLLFSIYEKLAGEVEARNVSLRSNLKDEEKKIVPIHLTEDVERELQIIIENKGNVESKEQRKKYERKEDEDLMKLSEFRETELKRDVEKEREDLNYVNEIIKDKTASEKAKKTAAGLKENILSRIREDKKQYADYLSQVKKVEDIVSNDSLEDYSLEELLEIYNNASYYMDNNRALYKAAKLRIGVMLQQQQVDFLKEANDKFLEEEVNKKDLNAIQKLFKSLADIPEYLPGVQTVSKALNRAYLAKRQESNALKSKHEKLAKAVISEKNKQLGLLKGYAASAFSSDSAKYFEYLDNGEGQLLTPEEAKAKGLTKAQTEYLDYFRELNNLRNASYDENDNFIANDIVKIDPKFRESLRSKGFIPALNALLSSNTDLENIISITDPATKKRVEKTYGEAQADLESGEGNILSKAAKAYALAYKARKAEGLKASTANINYRGGLTMKADKPRPKGRGYSKDFYAAANMLIDDYTHVKHMSPLIPLFDSIQYLYDKGFDNKMPNIAEFLESELQDKVYQNQKKFEPTVDAILKFARRLGSLTTMAFNVPANAINVAIGNYNNWRKEGGVLVLKGNGRMFTLNPLKMEKGINEKALSVLEKFNVIQPDFDSNPQMKAAKSFDKLAYFFNQIGEYQISGSMFLGLMTNEDWNSLEYKDGKLTLKEGVDEKAFNDRMLAIKDKVSGIQGKYDEKDRRMFMRGEIGKSVAQYKTWMPDWFKSRFGKEFINKYGETEIGSVTSALKVAGKVMSFDTFTKQGILELKEDLKRGLEIDKKNGRLKNREFAANLNGALTIATILIAMNSGDDDEKKKNKKYYDTLSLENALGNLLFIYDPAQTKYLITHPFAVVGVMEKFLDALDAALHGDTKKATKNLVKALPYGKAYSTYDKYLSNDGKK
jgi:hypothetical protein